MWDAERPMMPLSSLNKECTPCACHHRFCELIGAPAPLCPQDLDSLVYHHDIWWRHRFFFSKIKYILKKIRKQSMQYHVLKSKRDCFLTRENNNLNSVALRKKPPQWEGHRKTERTQRQSESTRYSRRSSRAAGELPWMWSVTEWETTSKEQIYHGLKMIYSAKKHGCPIAQTLAVPLSFPHSPVSLSESSTIPPVLERTCIDTGIGCFPRLMESVTVKACMCRVTAQPHTSYKNTLCRTPLLHCG